MITAQRQQSFLWVLKSTKQNDTKNYESVMIYGCLLIKNKPKW